jgi:hypothetical protein
MAPIVLRVAINLWHSLDPLENSLLDTSHDRFAMHVRSHGLHKSVSF